MNRSYQDNLVKITTRMVNEYYGRRLGPTSAEFEIARSWRVMFEWREGKTRDVILPRFALLKAAIGGAPHKTVSYINRDDVWRHYRAELGTSASTSLLKLRCLRLIDFLYDDLPLFISDMGFKGYSELSPWEQGFFSLFENEIRPWNLDQTNPKLRLELSHYDDDTFGISCFQHEHNPSFLIERIPRPRIVVRPREVNFERGPLVYTLQTNYLKDRYDEIRVAIQKKLGS